LSALDYWAWTTKPAPPGEPTQTASKETNDFTYINYHLKVKYPLSLHNSMTVTVRNEFSAYPLLKNMVCWWVWERSKMASLQNITEDYGVWNLWITWFDSWNMGPHTVFNIWKFVDNFFAC